MTCEHPRAVVCALIGENFERHVRTREVRWRCLDCGEAFWVPEQWKPASERDVASIGRAVADFIERIFGPKPPSPPPRGPYR